VNKFCGGQSNPTYRLDTPDGAYVLRKNPVGVLQPSAHAIDRENRAISAMYRAGLPPARPILYSDDEDVVGSAFYLVEYIACRVF
jgi:aminoglycoside phosphotransferase (APT) family kinase protein